MTKLLILIVAFAGLGCQSFDEPTKKAEQIDVDYGLTPPALSKAYEKGVKLLDKQDFAKAAKQFEYLIKKYPTSPLTMAMYYNAGAAYEALNQCKKAGLKFRKIVRASNGENQKIQAMALVRLSYAYECLSADKKVITSLLDARNRQESLKKYVQIAEVPARIAGAYGRLGNRKLANKFFKEAEDGLYQLRDTTQPAAMQRDALARTLFFMGRYWYNGFKVKKHDHILKTFERSQSYLVRAIELDSPNWSAIAAKNLIEVYQFIFVYLEKSLEQGQARGETVSRSQVNSLAIHALQGLRTLKRIKLPDRNPPKIVKSVFSNIDKLDKDYSDFLAKNNMGSELTQAESERQSLERKGRTINPNPKLEKMMKEMNKQKGLKVKPSN